MTERLAIIIRFGHQDGVLGIASLFRERAVTCGARDMTVRLWKVPEESQLVFTSSPTSLDCVAMIDERRFVTGAENGLVAWEFVAAPFNLFASTIAIWDTGRKKPIAQVQNAHGEGNWISSVASVHFTDLIASGTNVRVKWQIACNRLQGPMMGSSGCGSGLKVCTHSPPYTLFLW